MKTSHTVVRDKIFKDHQFYEPKQSTKPVSTSQYEKHQHQKVSHQYQSKKVPQFAGYKQSSSWNPLNRKYQRIDKPYKELYERKHRVEQYSDMKSDPFSIIPPKESSKKVITSLKPQYRPSMTYVAEQERRHILPKDREISKTNKNYHSQLGISQQIWPVPNFRDKGHNLRNSSSLMKLSLDFGLSGRDGLINRSMEGFFTYN